MSRYYSLFIALVLFSGCASKGRDIQRDIPLPIGTNSVNENFHKDDLYLLYALDSKYQGDLKTSASYFEKLYDIHPDVGFIDEAIKAHIRLKEYAQIKRLLDKALPRHPNDPALKRYLAAYYLDQKEYQKAQEILNNLIQEHNDPNDRILLASAQLGLGETKKALRFYEETYTKTKDPQTLLTLVNLLYNSEQSKKAKRLLQTHIDFISCDEKLCYRLLEIYQKEQDVNGLLRVATKLYEKNHAKEFAKMILDIYAYQKDYQGAIAFFEKYHIDDVALLELYVKEKKFDKASKLARALYHDSQDINFLAQLAMIEYEASPKPIDKKHLASIEKKFDTVIEQVNIPEYNNFYGYILIDHEIDIDRGIHLVKKALEKSPDAPFYIDSLAWGFYKKGDVKHAFKLLSPIMEQVREPEIIEHYLEIKKRLKDKEK